MIIKRQKKFSKPAIISTNAPQLGFKKGRKYDMDMNRLGRIKTAQGELSKQGTMAKEMRKLGKELNNRQQWQSTD